MADTLDVVTPRWSGFSESLRHALPGWLLAGAGLGLEVWQVLGIVLAGLLAWVLAMVVVAFGMGLARRLSARTLTTFDDELSVRLVAPARLLATALLVRPLLHVLELAPSVGGALNTGTRAAMLIAIFWGLWRTVTMAAAHVDRSEWARSRPGSKSLVRLGGSVSRVAIVAVGTISVLSELQYPVTSIVAGLGLGGLALALAAQKTVENLFGAFALAADQPFRVGDFVKVEDFVGTVESIGMRSTRFRTLDRTLIAIPNGKLADARLETFAARDRIRLACTIGVVYGTSAAQMRAVIAGLEAVLRAHPLIWPDAVVVRFSQLGASSLDIEVMAWFQTSDWGQFQAIRQDVLLQFLEVVERAGTSVAFPTQTLHWATPGPGVAAFPTAPVG